MKSEAEKSSQNFVCRRTRDVYAANTSAPTERARRGLAAVLLPLLRVGGDSPHVRLVHAEQYVFWLDVGVDDFALAVEVVETLQYLNGRRSRTLGRRREKRNGVYIVDKKSDTA